MEELRFEHNRFQSHTNLQLSTELKNEARWEGWSDRLKELIQDAARRLETAPDAPDDQAEGRAFGRI